MPYAPVPTFPVKLRHYRADLRVTDLSSGARQNLLLALTYILYNVYSLRNLGIFLP